ncbi:MAG: molybdopterin converting factor subunit 1 [Alteromonadaceae bacterium]|nr:molybdopterin converting factor subunit 1 [Alteromonadaceae bacterium]MBH85336.1 molybdopterin converting factor subunit 1 [Alteromonadaceae bacterium]|tara:strand:+ start:344 stop:619 length:276 start_codon:yes stop_codon:yes gene_type:complete
MANDNTATISITVRFFARLREQLATESLSLSLPSASRVSDLIDTLAAKGDQWSELKGSAQVMIAVNQTMARASHPLDDGDEVALFPPVTGG